MKVVRPPSFIPYGPLGHPGAKFFLEFEGSDLEQVTERFFQFSPDIPGQLPVDDSSVDARDSLSKQGYFILPVTDGRVPDEHVATLSVPPAYRPAPAGRPGRRLEDFPYTVAGYYQHYTYEPFVNNNPSCDHDFGLESVQYVFVVDGNGEVLPLEQVRAEYHAGMSRVGQVYLTVKCTRCGDVHAIKQASASGKVELY